MVSGPDLRGQALKTPQGFINGVNINGGQLEDDSITTLSPTNRIHIIMQVTVTCTGSSGGTILAAQILQTMKVFKGRKAQITPTTKPVILIDNRSLCQCALHTSLRHPLRTGPLPYNNPAVAATGNQYQVDADIWVNLAAGPYYLTFDYNAASVLMDTTHTSAATAISLNIRALFIDEGIPIIKSESVTSKKLAISFDSDPCTEVYVTANHDLSSGSYVSEAAFDEAWNSTALTMLEWITAEAALLRQLTSTFSQTITDPDGNATQYIIAKTAYVPAKFHIILSGSLTMFVTTIS